MTAEDVKASIEATLRNGTGHALRVAAVMREGTVEVIDTYTLLWKLKEPGLVTLPQWLTDMYVNSKKYLMAVLLRLVRSEMLEVMGQEYVRTARAKGVPELWVTIRHELKNAAIPVITVMGLQFGALV